MRSDPWHEPVLLNTAAPCYPPPLPPTNQHAKKNVFSSSRFGETSIYIDPSGVDNVYLIIRLFPVGGFILLFPILPHHLKYHETIDEITPTMQDFNFGVSYVLIVFNCRTHNDLKTVYVGFHLDETMKLLPSLFFKSLSCHPNCLRGTLFNMHGTP